MLLRLWIILLVLLFIPVMLYAISLHAIIWLLFGSDVPNSMELIEDYRDYIEELSDRA